MTDKLSPLQRAVDQDSYAWLSSNAPFYVDAILESLRLGSTTEEIRRYLSSQVGPERQAIAIRAEQCARHLTRSRVE